MDLGGAMFWAMDLDDFRGDKCDEGKFPLINTAKDIVNGGGGQQSTRTTTIRATTAKPADQSETAAFYCINCKYFCLPKNNSHLHMIEKLINNSLNDSLLNILSLYPISFFIYLAKEKQTYANISTNCQSYYECLTTPNGKQITITRTCPSSLIYVEDQKKCVKEKELINTQIKCSTKCQIT
jgi:hypothetical protein